MKRAVEIKRLEKASFAGKRFVVHYRSKGYYDIRACDRGFRMDFVPLRQPVERSLEDEFFGEWLEAPVAYGAFEDGKLLGFAEGAIERWNNRFRISNICVFDAAVRRHGVGTLLMNAILAEAEKAGARMAVLETQSCNDNAIAFYRKIGFEIIGFDLYAYSDTDPQRHEVRIEMGKKL